jgi:hypothetical protein
MRFVISLIAGALAAMPAFACSPAPFEAGTSAAGEACGMVFFDDEYTARGLGDATDLGGGFVVQFYAEGNACYANASMVVTDCSAGQAAIFGPGTTDSPMLSEEERCLAARALRNPARRDRGRGGCGNTSGPRADQCPCGR